jgi:hypothetical protein
MNPDGTLWGSLADDEGTGKLIYQAGSASYSGGRADAYYNAPFTSFGAYDLTTLAGKRAYNIGPEDSDATIELLNGEVIVMRAKWELNGDVLVGGRYPITPGITRYFGNGNGLVTLQINAGKTATLKDNVSFAMTAGAPLIGPGKLVAGKTEIIGGAGGWRVVSTVAAATEMFHIFAINDRTSRLQADGTATGTVVFTGRAGATITQKVGRNSLLTLGDGAAGAVINLGGTVVDAAPVAGAQLILEGDPDWTAAQNIAGRIVFTTVGSQILGSASSAGVAFNAAAPFTTASKIGGMAITKITSGATSTTGIHTDAEGTGGTPASGNFLGITVTTATDGISSGSVDSVIIDSTKLVE